MNDNDYIAVLREELDEIAAELEEARAYREKRKRLIEVLKEERASLCKQKEERIKRNEVLLRVETLEQKHKVKKELRDRLFDELTVAVKSCNRLLIATGRPPMEEPIPGRALPMADLKRKKKAEGESLSKSLTALPLVSPTVSSNTISQHTRITEASMPSFDTKTDLLLGSIHSATSSKSNLSKGSKVVVNGILKKRDTPRANPKKPVAKLKRRSNGSKKGTPKVKVRTAPKEEEKEKNQRERDTQKEKKPPKVKVDGDGDMSSFLDAIGYYSPEEEEKADKG